MADASEGRKKPMSKIYVTGHRNPDPDSLCGALSYANLKNLTDPENEYIPVCCSPVSDSVRKQMEAMELEIPEYKKDVYPKVRDVMLTSDFRLQKDDPIFDLINAYNADNPSVIPIYEGDSFMALLSVDDITAWFLADNREEVPVYSFSEKNMLKVLDGRLLHSDADGKIEGSLLVGAASFDAFCAILDQYPDSIIITGERSEHVKYAAEKQVPGIIITTGGDPGDLDLGDYKGSLILTGYGTAEALRRLRLAETIGSMIKKETESIEADDRFTEAKSIFLNSHTRGLAVTENGEFAGLVTRRCFLDMPAYSVIMVDHNEPAQSIDGIETAEVIEIIDHHRLDSLSTKMPIFIAAEALGSANTIIYQQYMRHGIMPDQHMAKVMLTGIIADTLILRSPTTTAFDMSTAEMLARIAKVDSIQEFGEKLFSITDNLEIQDPKEMILSDFKKYENSGVKIGVGQCEVTTLGNVDEYAEAYLDELAVIAEGQGLDWALLMITDVLREQSVLLASGYRANRELPYEKIRDGIYSMPGVMSRKKQLLPVLLSVTA